MNLKKDFTNIFIWMSPGETSKYYRQKENCKSTKKGTTVYLSRIISVFTGRFWTALRVI